MAIRTTAARVYDFNSAYARVHGHAPRVRAGFGADVQVEDLIQLHNGHKPAIIAKLDIGKRREQTFTADVCEGDAIFCKAGMDYFQLTFIGIDRYGMLVGRAFRNGVRVFDHHLAEGFDNALPIWEGFLEGGQRFELSIGRLSLERHGNVLGRVLVAAEIIGPQGFNPAG